MNKPRGRPFRPGNPGGPGRPKGRKNNVTLEVQRLLAEHAKPLLTKCIVKALQGDMTAMRLCIDRLMAPRRDSNLSFAFLRVRTAADVERAQEQLRKLIANGELTPAEGELVARILASRIQTIETVQHEERIRKLEERVARGEEPKA